MKKQKILTWFCACGLTALCLLSACGGGTPSNGDGGILRQGVQQFENAQKTSQVHLDAMKKMLIAGNYTALYDYIMKNRKEIAGSLIFQAIKESIVGGK